jgi:16S rRNA (cytidine1402-2'-O)-methyltransferase
MLTFIPTPIGNLDDISYRCIQSLLNTDIYLCEDTRVTKKLLHLLSEKHNINFDTENKEFISLHSHNESKFVQNLTPDFFHDRNVSYVSDAGMPCVSDPGAILVQYCLENDIEFDLIPGANALLTAYAMSGFNKPEFSFFGFLPHKGKDRQAKLDKVLNSQNLAILYESPHRLMKLIEELKSQAPQREIFLVKELTKLHQKKFKGTAQEIYEEFKTVDTRGEWVVVIDCIEANDGEAITYDDLKLLDIAPKQKAKLLSKLTGKNTKEIYNQLLQEEN